MGEMNRRRFVKYAAGAGALVTVTVVSVYLMRASGWGFLRARLPPGQEEVSVLQFSTVGPVPEISTDEWRLDVAGEVENPLELAWKDLVALPKASRASDLHCVAGWSKMGNLWEGVAFKEIAKLAHPTASAKYATIESYGDVGSGNEIYVTQIPLKDVLHDNVLFAYSLDGKQLSPEHGGPVRLIVPDRYGYKSAKWVKRVTFSEKQELGYYERRGYSTTADPWTEDRLA